MMGTLAVKRLKTKEIFLEEGGNIQKHMLESFSCLAHPLCYDVYDKILLMSTVKKEQNNFIIIR